MLKDHRHILLNNSNFSNSLPEPLKDSSLEMLSIGVSEDGYLDMYPGYKITSYSIDEVAKKITFNLEERHRANVLYCKACNSHKLHIHGYRTVSFKDAPINDFKVELQVQVPRYKCFCCGYTQSNKNSLFHPHYRMTRKAYGYILSELQREDSTITKISRTSGIHWQIVKDVEKAVLMEKFNTIDTSKVRYIAMDEISIKKRHTYATLIINAQTQELLAAIEGRRHIDITPFFEMLKERGHAQNILGATMDANAGFNSIVKEYCQKAVIVLDQFHVLQNYNNDVIEAERKRLSQQIEDSATKLALTSNKTAKQICMGLKWAVFGGYEKLLSNEEIENELKELVLNNQTLSKVCIMGDCLRRLWTKVRSKTQAAYSAVNWCKIAEESGIESLADFGRRFRKHLSDVIHASTTGLNTSILEGMNNRCKVIKRMAYGFRDIEYYFLKLFQAFSIPKQSKLKLS